MEQAEKSHDERERRAEEVLKRLELVNAFDLDGIKSSLEASFLTDDDSMDIQEHGSMGDVLGGSAVRRGTRKLVVIDSIGPILGPCLSTGDSHGTSDLVEESLNPQLIS